eukprot:3684549-Ditylum_brightwellii.AAC.1
MGQTFVVVPVVYIVGVVLKMCEVSQPVFGVHSSAYPPTARNGVAGVGLDRQRMRSRAACMAASLDAISGIFTRLGKNSTVSAILSLLVAGICTL